MNITSQNSHPIHNGFNRTNRQHGSSSDVQQKQPSNPLTPSLTSQIVESQFNAPAVVADSQKIRPTINAQPVFDQNLTHRGSQAKDMYQEVELSNEAELMPRLSVIA